MSKKSSYIHSGNVRIRPSRKGRSMQYIYKKTQQDRIEEALTLLNKDISNAKNKNKKSTKEKIDIGKLYIESVAKLVSKNIISQRDAIVMFDARKLGKYREYKKNVSSNINDYTKSIKEKFKIVDGNPENLIDKQYYEDFVKPFREKREKYIKSGLYEELRWEIYKQNYLKAIEKTGEIENLDSIKEGLNRITKSERDEFIKRAPEINAFYHPAENIEEITNDYDENILNVIDSLDIKRNKG